MAIASVDIRFGRRSKGKRGEEGVRRGREKKE